MRRLNRLMLVYEGDPIASGRQHPWTVGEGDPEWSYVDFKSNPELIPVSLEDFIPLEEYPAIGFFYSMVSWLNGPDSKFETNDSALRGPQLMDDVPAFVPPDHRYFVRGRFTVFFRELSYNCDRQRVRWFLDSMLAELSRKSSDKVPSAVGLSLWPHGFIDVGREGQVFCIRFSAWGVDCDNAMFNLNCVFECIDQCLKAVSAATEKMARH